MAIQDMFVKCAPYLYTTIGDCGTLTVCDAVIPTPSELESIYKSESGKWRAMKATLALQMELKMCGVKQSPFLEFLESNRVSLDGKITKENLTQGLDRIRPYILATRKHPVNNNYWIASKGQTVSYNHWQMEMSSPTGIPADATWFNPGEYVFITGIGEGGVQINCSYKITTSELNQDGTAVVVVMENMSSASYLQSEQKQNPTSGIAIRGTNNVSDFESFCVQPPGILNKTFEEFWIQTSRTSLCVDELYEEYRNLILAQNEIYSQFYYLPTTEYNRQVGEDWSRRMANAFMYNIALPYQTVSTLEQLESIEAIDPLNPSGRCVGKRANAIGVYEQHVQCGRVVDLAGGALDLMTLFNEFYKLSRIRESIGSPNPNNIDLLMPSTYAVKFQDAMLSYFKSKTDSMWRLNSDLSSKLEQSPLGFKWRSFQLDWPDVKINVITDRYFDDYLDQCKRIAIAENKPELENLGRKIWIIDWSNNYKGIIASNRITTKTADIKQLAQIDPTYRCIMQVPTTSTTLTSETWTVICETPQADLIIENISNDPITTTGASDEYTD